MNLSDFDYPLPEHLIARFPLEKRSDSRLLHMAGSSLYDRQFTDLPSLLDAGDLIVFNDTKVLKARLFGKKTTGGAVELLVERLVSETVALCHVRASKAPNPGAELVMAHGAFLVTVLARQDGLFVIDFAQSVLPVLETYGALPIPPYFERAAQALDDSRYQTVFHDPKKQASVAAPTASLHFDELLLNSLEERGIKTTFVTLHVGAGTFSPVRTEDISKHQMHSEYAELSQTTIDKIQATKATGGNVVAVGTTVTRVLETAAAQSRVVPKHEQHKECKTSAKLELTAYSGDTDIFIYPGFEFQVVDKLITNFHLPKSTLLMLVSAFGGHKHVIQAYEHAMTNSYRFYSYGDAMLIERY